MLTPNEQPNADRPTEPESFSTSDESPPTQPESLVPPPPRKPPTAISAAADPLFPPNPARNRQGWRPIWGRRTPFAQLATEIFDTLDEIADRIAEGLGLRH